jgi:hypothetical protein
MTLTVEAIYENGILRPTQALPLQEQEHVRVTIHSGGEGPPASEARPRGYGLLRWTGSVEDLDYLIEDAENDPLEGP